jgi:3-oxoacyl-[acyl-carrier protein] reductase
MQAVIYPYMKKQQYGRIVNISSISGMNGGHTSSFSPESKKGRSGPAYAASKGGVIALTKWVAKEVGDLGITCNSVAPGATETGITSGINYSLDNQVIKRMGQPEDIAEAVLYFASQGSGYTTGQVLKVCGGGSIG